MKMSAERSVTFKLTRHFTRDGPKLQRRAKAEQDIIWGNKSPVASRAQMRCEGISGGSPEPSTRGAPGWGPNCTAPTAAPGRMPRLPSGGHACAAATLPPPLRLPATRCQVTAAQRGCSCLPPTPVFSGGCRRKPRAAAGFATTSRHQHRTNFYEDKTIAFLVLGRPSGTRIRSLRTRRTVSPQGFRTPTHHHFLGSPEETAGWVLRQRPALAPSRGSPLPSPRTSPAGRRAQVPRGPGRDVAASVDSSCSGACRPHNTSESNRARLLLLVRRKPPLRRSTGSALSSRAHRGGTSILANSEAKTTAGHVSAP